MKMFKRGTGLLTAFVLVLGMTGGLSTGVSGQEVAAGEGALVCPGDNVVNTELHVGEDALPLEDIGDGRLSWTNLTGTVYQLVPVSTTQEVPVYLQDAEGNLIYDENGQPIIDHTDVVETVYYQLQPWGGTVEVFNGTLVDPPETPAFYSLPGEVVYSFTGADGIPVQVPASGIAAAAFPLGAQISVVAGDPPVEGQVFQKWSVYTVDGETLVPVADEALDSDPAPVPGINAGMLAGNPMSFSVSGAGSRFVLMPVYVDPAPQVEAEPEAQPEATPEAQPEATPEVQPDGTPEGQSDGDSVVQLDFNSEGQPDPNAEIQIDLSPDPTIDPTTGYQINPVTGRLIDPTTQYEIDPTTGYLVNPVTERLIDPTTQYEIDPVTGYLIKPETGRLIDPTTQYEIDPETGYLIHPETSRLIDPKTQYEIDPETGYLIEPETGNLIHAETGYIYDREKGYLRDQTGTYYDRTTLQPVEIPQEETPAPEPAKSESKSRTLKTRKSLNTAKSGAENNENVTPKHTLTVTGASSVPANTEPLSEGTEVTVTADDAPEGMEFDRWDVSGIDGLTEEQLISPSLTFQIQDTDVNVAAQYKAVIPTETITVQNAAINDIPVNDNGDGTFTATVEKGTNVTVTANDAPEGMEFDRWNVSGIDGLTEEQLISTSLTFQIQDTDVNVAAQYKAVIPTETITVQNATIENSENIPVNNNDDGTVSATVNSGTTVVLSANEAPEGMEFDRWDVTSQEEVNTSSRTEPTLEVVLGAADVKVEPVYTAAAAFPTVTYSEPSGGTIAEKKDEYEENGKKYRKYTYTLTPSEGYQIDSFTAKKGDADADNLKVSDDRTTLTFTTGEEEGTVTVTVAASLSKTYKLTVNAGSGSGSYKAGSAVTITADAPQTGWRFTKWTVSGNGTIGSETESTTTFTMAESDATVTANYEQVAHTLTVNSGSGTGAYNFGDQVTITADVPAPGWRFTKWTVSGNGTIASETESPTVFTMADTDVSVSANYEQIPYTLTVSSGSGTGTYVSGDQVVITADPPQTGYRFKNWTLTSGDGAIISPSSSQTTFAMGASDAFVSANYELIPYTLTVKKGSGSGTYTMGTSTQVTPNFPASGKEFDRWEKTSGKISFDSTEKYYATVTMKASDATITALYKDGPNPNDNTITGLADGAEYLKSTTLTFTAAGAGMDNNNPNPGDYRYRPAGYQIGSVGGSWTSSPYTTSMAINAVGDYTLTVTYAKDVYDGNSWNPDGTSVTKSITFHVVNALSVQTGDSSPILPLAIAGGAALAVIIILVVILRRRGRN